MIVRDPLRTSVIIVDHCNDYDFILQYSDRLFDLNASSQGQETMIAVFQEERTSLHIIGSEPYSEKELKTKEVR